MLQQASAWPGSRISFLLLDGWHGYLSLVTLVPCGGWILFVAVRGRQDDIQQIRRELLREFVPTRADTGPAPKRIVEDGGSLK